MIRINHVRLPLATLAVAVIISLGSSSASAASFNVATGNDEAITNGSCSLSEAIGNINDQFQTNVDCPAGDGVNDTINIPAGTITLTANLAPLNRSATIKGAGMGQSIIDGDGQYEALRINGFSTKILAVNDLTITGFMNFGIKSISANTEFARVEIDGANSANNDGFMAGIDLFADQASDSLSSTMGDVYVHDIDLGAVNILAGIVTRFSGGAELDISIKNTTVSRLNNPAGQVFGITYSTGVLDGSNTAADINANLANITINNLTSPVSTVFGLGLLSSNLTTTSNVSVGANNVTIAGIRGITNPGSGFESAGVMVAGVAPGSGSVINNTINLKDILLADNQNAGTSRSCNTVDFSGLYGGTDGTVNNTIISGGGNLADDTTCTSFLNQPTDRNSLTNLGSSLSPLASNGGFVPTMALKSGSPAIDSGVTVAGLTTDARGVARPQGLAYDSGAYESPFTTAIASTSSEVTTAATPTLPKTGQSETFLAAISFGFICPAIALIRRLHLAK